MLLSGNFACRGCYGAVFAFSAHQSLYWKAQSYISLPEIWS